MVATEETKEPKKQPGLLSALDEVMGDATAGDPLSGLKWTHKSLRTLERELARRGYGVSAPTISRLLPLRAYSLRVNHKRLAGKQSPGREEQFQYLAQRRKAFLRRGGPVISVDTKKKELIGLFKTPGHQWRRMPHEVLIYDFPSTAVGKAIPSGIYDVGRNKGYVVVGVSHETPQSLRSGHSARGGSELDARSTPTTPSC